MKGKSTVKIPRRAAGLQIRAALEPRPDSGANLASDIFRAVKENEAGKVNLDHKADKTPELIDSKTIASETTRLSNLLHTNNLVIPDPATVEDQQTAEIVPGTALVSFGGGQMRVVSLQQPKSRKVNKQPKKSLQIVTTQNQPQKIPMLFERTKAEELYDLLYQLTLGASEPCASVRVRRSDLMASTNIKTRLTLDLNLKRLEENELLKIESRPGEQEGNIYTVFPLPEN